MTSIIASHSTKTLWLEVSYRGLQVWIVYNIVLFHRSQMWGASENFYEAYLTRSLLGLTCYLHSLRKLLKMIVRGLDPSAQLLRGWCGYIIRSHLLLLSRHQTTLRAGTSILGGSIHLVISLLLLHTKLSTQNGIWGKGWIFSQHRW